LYLNIVANTLHSSVNGLLLMECMCFLPWPTSQGGSLVLQNRCLVLAGTILILRTQMLPNLHQYSRLCIPTAAKITVYCFSLGTAVKLGKKKMITANYVIDIP